MVNLMSGVVAIGFVLRGEPRNAGYAVIVGFLLGDLVDGTVARMTGTANRFGAEFDAVTDHFVHVFVPALVLYAVYQRGGHGALGLAAVAFLITGATLRHACFAAAKFDYPLCWCGVPRTVSGFAALSFPLSNYFQRHSAYVPGFAVVAGLSVLNLAPIPYLTHRGARAMQAWVKVAVAVYFLSAPVAFVVARGYVFDAFFVGLVVFAAGGWIPVHPDERRGFYDEHRRWRAALSG